MKKKKILLSSILIAGLFSSFSLSQKETKITKASIENVFSISDIFDNVYNNNLNDVNDNSLFSYGLRHGSISTSSGKGNGKILPGCVKFDLKDNGDFLISSSEYDGGIKIDKSTIYSSDDDRIIIKIVAKENLIITNYANNDIDLKDLTYTNINYYVFDDYNEIGLNTWPDAKTKVNNINNLKKEDFYKEIFINKGQTFYWEWGYQYSGSSRSWNIGKSGSDYNFKIEKDNYTQKEVKNETYQYLDLIEQSASISGKDLVPNKTIYSSSQTLMTIGFRHGDVSNNDINYFSNITPTSLGRSNDGEPLSTFMQNWRIATTKGDGAIIYLKALTNVRLNISRPNLGNDSLNGGTLNIYKNLNKIYSYYFDGSNTSVDAFSYSLNLEEDDEVYYEFIHYGSGFSILSMGDDGSQYTSLPLFKAVEVGQINSVNISSQNLIEKMIGNNKPEYILNDELGTISIYNGSIKSNNLTPAYVNSNYIGSALSNINKNGVFNLGNEPLTICFTSKINASFSFSFNVDNLLNGNINIASYQYVNLINKTHRLYDFSHFNKEDISLVSSPIILSRNDVCYIEFSGLNFSSVLINNFSISEKAIGDGVINNYPLYDSSLDFSTLNSINHETLAYESARTRCKPVLLKDYSISLLTGLVNEDKKDASYAFSYIQYESGEYLEGNIDKSMLMTGNSSNFDGDNFASVLPDRIKTSKANSVIYKMVAFENTHIDITHSATSSGWIKSNEDENPGIYFSYIQSNGKIFKQLDKKAVNSHINDANLFGFSFDLKQGDTAYLVFESEIAYQRNLNIEFSFLSNSSLYNEELRNNYFQDAKTSVYMYDAVSDILSNDCKPVIYEDSLEINLCHGDVKSPQYFKKNECTGDGSGSASDALYTDGVATYKAGFQRWQIRAGKLGDNAIMWFKAVKDIHLVLTHPATIESWASFSSFKYYIVDTDNFFDYKEERYVSSDLEDNYFGYDVHLKANQSLVISYQSNDDSAYGVVDLLWCVEIDTKTFEPSLVNDFTKGRLLQASKDSYIDEINKRISYLNEDDYSVSNWAKIENYQEEFIDKVVYLTDQDEINSLFIETINNINNVLSIKQEEKLLANSKASALLEARQYIEANRKYFLEKTISLIERRYSNLQWSINASKSITSIKVNLLNFKTYINNLPKDRINLQNGLTVGFSLLGAAIIACGVITIFIKKAANKKLLVVERNISTLKYDNNVEYLMPRKGAKCKAFISYMKRYWPLYLMVLPMIVYLFIFSYVPMGGLSLAFKDFDFHLGIWSSPWATTDGKLDIFKYFKQLFDNPDFISSFLITLKISGLRLLVGFFIPIIITVLLLEVKSKRFSKGFQIISYLPHFISWIVIYGILISLTTSGSPLQNLLEKMFGHEIGFFSDPDVFLWLVIFSNIWKEAGWSTIIYFAAAASINPELYEAAEIDGATRWERILKVTLPGLIPAISINLILQASGFVFGGFDQIFALTGNGVNQSILPYVNITEIFLYKAGITSFEYSLATVVGLFNSVISFVLVLMSNFIIKKIGGDGLW